jgi:FG-GAP repeat/Fibronectin type III domain
MRRLLPILLLAGCYRADDLAGGQLRCAAPPDECPDGYTCIGGACWKNGTDLAMSMDLSTEMSPDLSSADLAMPSPDLTVVEEDLREPDLLLPDLREPDLSLPDLSVPDLSGVVAAPQLTGVVPGSPASSPSPVVSGTAPPNSTVNFYLGSCGTTLLASVVADGAGNFSKAVPVAVDANNSIVAEAVAGAFTSPCSSPLPYVEDQTKPGIVGNLQATAGNRQVGLSWNPASDDRSGIDSYEVTCSGAGCPPTITGLTGLSTTVTGLTNCTAYTFTVRARDKAGNLGDPSSSAGATTALPNPNPIAYVPGPSILEYAFSPVPNATSYVVCTNVVANACAGTQVPTSRTSGWIFGVASDPPSASFKVALMAKDGSCSSAPSADSTQPVPTHYTKHQSNGVNQQSYLGNAVTMLGDLDGDGFPEYMAGAPNPISTNSMEAAYVFSTVNGAEMCHVTGDFGGPARPHDLFGSAVTGGDVNGDGKADLIIGAPNHSTDYTFQNFGQVWLYDGASCLASPAPYNSFRTTPGGTAGDKLGASLAFLGDLDGDGKGEYAAGAPGGKYVAVYKGSNGALFYPAITSAATGFGQSLAAVGDLDGDGANDLVVGAPAANTNQGQLFVYSGKTGSAIGSPIDGSAADQLGTVVAGVGDVNGDGVADFAAAGSGNQVVRVYSGASFQVLWTKGGTDVAAMGDMDRDGRTDFVVVTPSGGINMYSGFDGNLLYSFGLPFVGPHIAYGGHLEDGDDIGLLVGMPAANTNTGTVHVFVTGTNPMKITHGEFIDAFGPGGYGAGDTHAVLTGDQQFFSHYGGTDPATWAIVTNGSGGFLSTTTSDPNYHAGPTTPRFDLLRVTDSLNRSVDTRVLAADGIAPSPSPLARPAPLDAVNASGTGVDLSWMNPGGATLFTIEYRQATQAWVRFGTTSATTAQVTGLLPNTNYAFRVQATIPGTGAMSLWSRTVYRFP